MSLLSRPALFSLAAAALAAYWFGVRPQLLRWGATEEEAHGPLPGDQLVPRPQMQTTRAATINAPAAAVWPWLAQMGQGRGGLYSYDWLENIFGLDFHSADDVHPEWQDLKLGDRVWLAPHDDGQAGALYLEVAAVEPGRTLVLHSPGDPAAGMAQGFPHVSWTFVLRELDAHTTRLLVRFRSDHLSTLVSTIVNHYGLEPVHFLMERKMLLGIRARAETASAPVAKPTLLDSVLPEAEFRGAVTVTVDAPPARIFQAFWEVSLADMPLATALGEVRYLPSRLAGRLKDVPYIEPFVPQLLRERGNIVLAEDPGRELVIGTIGKFHDLIDQQPVPLQDRAAFAAFTDPAYQQLAMSFRVAPDAAGKGYTVTLEHRTHALSDASRRDFARYWLAIKPASAILSLILLRAVKARAERLASASASPHIPGTLGTGGTVMAGRERLEALLKEQGVAYQVIEHPLSLTAQHTAEIEHVPGRRMMKVVMLETDGRPVMAVVPAPAHVNTEKAAAQLGARHARIAHEDEFAGLFPDCETGAMPPFGNLYGVPVYVDASFVEQDTVVFPAASHTASIVMKFHDFQRLVRPVVADLIVVEQRAAAR